MSYGVQTFDSSGALQFDSTTTLGGGVVADLRQYAAGAGGEVVDYPQWAGLTPLLLDCGGSDGFVTLTTSPGYPRVTVTSPSGPMTFAVAVF